MNFTVLKIMRKIIRHSNNDFPIIFLVDKTYIHYTPNPHFVSGLIVDMRILLLNFLSQQCDPFCRDNYGDNDNEIMKACIDLGSHDIGTFLDIRTILH